MYVRGTRALVAAACATKGTERPSLLYMHRLLHRIYMCARCRGLYDERKYKFLLFIAHSMWPWTKFFSWRSVVLIFVSSWRGLALLCVQPNSRSQHPNRWSSPPDETQTALAEEILRNLSATARGSTFTPVFRLRAGIKFTRLYTVHAARQARPPHPACPSRAEPSAISV